ncbi:MAG: transposase, partial [Bacteroidota bacterium]
INNILTHDHDGFHSEKEALLQQGIQHAHYLQADDTGARHEGKNGYCTFIGNELFSSFTSTSSKSRINFLQALSGHPSYIFNEVARNYMTSQGLGAKHFQFLDQMEERFVDQQALQSQLEKLKVSPHAIKTMTEAALLGGLTEKGLSQRQVILSDDAGQFNILNHALCWIHVERNLQKIHTYTQAQRDQLDQVLNAFWQLYQLLKTYKTQPSEKLKQKCLKDFQAICEWQTEWIALQKGLDKLKTYQNELLVVLDHPKVPLHNNQSERDIREFVKKRKISGSTRSEQGRRARDTFASLKKTCRKLNVSFWDFLFDRLTDANQIDYLPEVMTQALKAK